MFITITQIIIVAIIVLLAMFITFFIGSTAAVTGMENNIINAANSGTIIKAQGKPCKVLSLISYRALVDQAAGVAVWQWDTIGGKQR